MTQFDQLLSSLSSRGADRAVLTNDQPMRIYAGGQEAAGAVVAGDRLLQTITPAKLQANLGQDGRIEFVHSSTIGPVAVTFERNGASLQTHLAFSPNVRAENPTAPAPVSTPVFPPPSTQQPYAAQSLPVAPIPAPDSVPAPRPPSGKPLESIGCMPALILGVLCFLGLLAVVAVTDQRMSTLFVLATSIGVLIDAHKIGARRGLVGGIANMGPWGWFFGCLLIWLVGFPCYLAARPLIIRANAINNRQ